MMAMSKICGIIIVVLLITFTSATVSADESTTRCSTKTFESRIYKSCVDLPAFNSLLHYNYHPTTATVEIAYRHPASSATSKWVAWALNPTSKGMVGSQSLVAYRSPINGSLVAYTSPITSYGTTLAKGDLSFNVTDLNAESGNDEIIIFATIKVPNNETLLNQVWQEGLVSDDGSLQMHSLSGSNVRSMASLDLRYGVVAPAIGGGASLARSSTKNIHGIINALSWGILMPIGAMIARYVKFFPSADPAWFYLHVGCQLSGYILGIAGWATGLALTSGLHRVHHQTHRCIGITLFIIATLQIFALKLRPNKDHKYRFYWNIYHHSVGYATIILGIVNIFEGFKILNPDRIWKIEYSGLLIALVIIAVILEATTWYLVYRRKKTEIAAENKSGQDISRV